MNIRLGIDISAIQYNRGVSRYTSNLCRALSVQKDLDLTLFGTSLRQYKTLEDFARKEVSTARHVLLHHPTKVLHVLWNELHVLPVESFMGEIDIFHSWEIQPPTKHAKLVTTIHDLAMLRFPKTADPYVLDMNKASWKHIKKEGAAVIAVSQATKKDIVEYLDIDPKKIFVVPEAMTSETKISLTSKQQKALLHRFDIQKPFLLFVGTKEPRKNLQSLIEAWKPIKKDFNLVLAGASGWEDIKEEEGLISTGVVSNKELAALYKSASVFCYPSLYEGFGLPILDAFYHNTPVVTSNVSSMPEVAGNAAVYVKPEEVESIKEGIEKALKQKKTLVRNGQKRLKKFSWKKTAEETMKVYRKVMET